MTILIGLLIPLFVYLLVLLMHSVLPAKHVAGYVKDPVTKQPYRYRLNGLLVMIASMLIWAGTCYLGWLPWDYLYQYRRESLVGACVIGLIYTLVLVLPAPSTGKSLAVDLFLGRVENLQYARNVDVKMYLYLAGAVMLLLNILSFATYHVSRFGDAANVGVYLYVFLFVFFLFDYLTFERVHLYTYDLFAERLGFKLAWGCLVFYPYFYVIGLWGTAELPSPDSVSTLWLILAVCVFFSGWMIARGANMQKYYFKRFPNKKFLFWKPETVSNQTHQLLCNGFWGASRHINYLGEILMASGLALSLGHFDSPWPWVYPLYYLALLLPRERDDDRRCAEKYGPLWDDYRAKVRYRIIPFIY